MICPVLSDIPYAECIQWLETSKIVELRLDQLSLSNEEVRSICSFPTQKIATCRPGTMTEKKREEILLLAINGGATHVDLEVESIPRFVASISKLAAQSDCKKIISYHNFDKTPQKNELIHIINRCLDLGADLIKLACRIIKKEDMALLMGLYEDSKYHNRLISLGMGSRGKLTRIMAPFLGSPFTYACISPQKRTADGQLTVSEMEKIFREFENVL